MSKWEEVRLESLIKISKGKKCTQSEGDGVRYIQIGDLRNDNVMKFTEPTKGSVLCNTEDVLIAWDGANAGTIGYNLEGAIGSTIAKLSPKIEYFTPYLGKFLQSKFRYLRNHCTGATIPHISKKVLVSLKIPLPPLDIQKQIAELLDTADALRRQTQAQLDQLDTLAQSVFLEMFGEVVKNDKDWKIVKFGDVMDSRLGKMLDKKKQTGENIRKYLRNANVQWNKIEIDDLSEMDFNEKDRKEFELKKGDILMCEGGEVGRCAIWNEEVSDCYFQKALHRIRPKKDLILANFIIPLMKNYSDFGGFNHIVTSATIAHLTGVKLKKLKIPLPPLALQIQFAEIIENIEQQKEQLESSLRESEGLFGGLLQEVFG